MKLKLPEEPHYLLPCLDEQLQHTFSSNLLHSWLQEGLRAEFFHLSLLGGTISYLSVYHRSYVLQCMYLFMKKEKRVRSVSPLRFLPWNICLM